MSQELEHIGVRGVDAGDIEAEVLAQAQAAGAAPAPEPSGADPPALQQQLHAVQRELRTVAAAVEGYQQQQQQPDAAEQQEHGPGGSTAKQVPAAVAASSLQHAVMQQRLGDLQARKEQLEQSLAELGVAPALATQQPAAAAGRPAGQVPQSGQRKPVLPARGAGSGKGGRGRQRAQLDLAEADVFEGMGAAPAGSGGLVETERDRLIRLGILTPFDRLDGFERRVQQGPHARGGSQPQAAGAAAAPVHDSIRRVGEAVRAARAARPTSILMDPADLPRPDRPTRRIDEGFWRQSASGRVAPVKKKRRRTLAPAKRSRVKRPRNGGDDGLDSGEEEELQGESDWPSASGGSDAEAVAPGSGEDLGGEFDDADEAVYEERRAAYLRRRGKQASRAARRRLRKAGGGGGQAAWEAGQGGSSLEDSDAPMPSGSGGSDSAAAARESDSEEGDEEEDVVFEGGYRLPADLYGRLFDYQRTAVKWMWELHTQRAGGIIGDEMGLGKTIQVIAFLAGLHHSGLFRPSLIVCPATVLRQWLRELRAWWPLFRVALLHDSARSGAAGGARPSRQRLIREIAESGSGVLLTTYETMRLQRGDLLGVEWGYVVLDEGHKIRNPDAEVTLAAKQVQTVHRLIMSGSPIQNRLTELWSLFDFVFPGKLGTLPVFTAQFALPIQIGGYANASPLQVSTAYRCAVILRDLIAPYLLRRRKADVQAQLPRKTEQVLFCGLTSEQRDLYRGYLGSKELREIFSGSRTALAGIDVLRKVCNHPDLLERAKWEAAQDYGNPERSGKLQVLAKVLRHWREQGHKALVFTQTQQMLDILEKHAEAQGYTYHRMDGSTSVAQRARLIDDFNNNPEVFCFLLTTRVGGLGVNLTGANRVVLYDPDWNPSTDVQARERAWRIGQAREVVVYRLITSGTIEEKVYHRQVYKHFLTDKVLRDPRQRRFFRAKDLTDLFTLGDEYADGTETASLFASLGTEVMPEAAEEEEALQGSASDRDDYGGDECDGNGVRPRRHSSSPALGAAAALPAGVRSEVAADGGEADGGSGGEAKGDAGMLRELFEGSGVRGAIDHGKVEGANDPERRAADQEAARIARRAAEALRQSQLQCQAAPVSQPTWTGRSGAAGVPGAQPRFGRAANPRLQAGAAQEQQPGGRAPTGTAGRRFGSGAVAGPSGSAGLQAGTGMGAAPRSSEILARLRQRQAAAEGAAAAAAVDPEMEQAQALAARIASFLQARGGAVASDELVSHFQASVGAAQLPLFRGVLKQVAALQRRTPAQGGGKAWVLRPEFANNGGGGA